MSIKARNQPSTIELLPEAVIDELRDLRVKEGFTVDELRDHLLAEGHEVSRSAIGRWCRQVYIQTAGAAARSTRSRQIATAVMDELHHKPDNQVARLCLELVHANIMDIMLEEDGEGEDATPRKTKLDEMKSVALILERSLRAEKVNAETARMKKEEGRREEAERVKSALEQAGRAGEIDTAALERAKRIMGYA